jgi:DNA-binding CsgD family transcriptional regulator
MGDDPVAWWDNPAWTITIPGTPGYSGGLDLRPDGAGGCTVGYLLAPWARGHGYAVRALQLACAWAFDTLRVEVVRWECYSGNHASRKVAVTAGFRIIDGTLRKALPYRGIRRDAWLGDLVPQDLSIPAPPTHTSPPARRQGALPNGPALTARERDVLGQLAQGKSNRDLARALGISENTVKNHVRSVLEKLNAQSRSEAVVIALKAGIVALHH